jgi:integrase
LTKTHLTLNREVAAGARRDNQARIARSEAKQESREAQNRELEKQRGAHLPLTGRLWEIIQDRVRVRRLDCPAVFHHDGYKIGGFKKSWATACKKSGLEGTLVHDLRRCAARNLSRDGLPEAVAKEITGHKTRSMYRRYRIVDRRDLREASERLQLQVGTKVMSRTPTTEWQFCLQKCRGRIQVKLSN